MTSFPIRCDAFIIARFDRCATYLGPGDYARKKRESLSGALYEGCGS
jgi:hypothetical protein